MRWKSKQLLTREGRPQQLQHTTGQSLIFTPHEPGPKIISSFSKFKPSPLFFAPLSFTVVFLLLSPFFKILF